MTGTIFSHKLVTNLNYTMRLILYKAFPIIIALLVITGCDENNNFNIFSVENDISLGEQVNQEIRNDPSFNLLERSQYPQEYAYLDNMVEEILNSGEVAYREEFNWTVTIIKDDETLNAFATPGGYIYVYTGLIKYLNNADALSGVMAHEIAHADLRHTSRTLQKQYGVSLLLSVLLGNDASSLEQIVAQIAGTAAGLSFSRDYENEADMQSVEYLSAAPYACNSAAYFFEKLEAEGEGAGVPEFLSTHPSPENRISDINARAGELNCDTSLQGDGYPSFKDGL